MTMSNNTEFLKVYKQYESLLREQQIDIKTVEDSSDDKTSNRLRICRQLRNYLSHNDDNGFIDISDEQLKFITGLYNRELMKGDIVKKHVKSPSSTTVDSKLCIDVINMMLKLKTDCLVIELPEPYVKSTRYVIYDMHSVLQYFLLHGKTSKISDVKSKVIKASCFASPDTKMCDMSDDLIICTDDGTKTGKLIGIKY